MPRLKSELCTQEFLSLCPRQEGLGVSLFSELQDTQGQHCPLGSPSPRAVPGPSKIQQLCSAQALAACKELGALPGLAAKPGKHTEREKTNK